MPGRREVHTSELKVEQAPTLIEGQNDEDRSSPIVTDKAMHGGMTKDYLDELAFMEEPVTIRFSSSEERFSSPFVECAVNGVGIEALGQDKKWHTKYMVPVNVNVVTKRKYVEVFARCKHTDIKAFSRGIPNDPNHDPENIIVPSTMVKYPFSVIGDSTRGQEWLSRIIR